MKYASLLFIFCTLHSTKGVSGIIGGTLADIDDFRYKVSIQSVSNVNHVCSGVILQPLWVLTSALCIAAAPPLDLAVAVGAHDFWQPSALHYGHSSHFANLTDILANDIALIKLTEPIELGENAAAAATLPAADIEPGVISTISGWGSTQVGGGVNTELYHLKQMVVGRFMCQMALEMNIPDGQFCATNAYRTGPCPGDEGAPLMSEEAAVSGLASWRLSCGDGLPSLYTGVFPYVEWIRDTMELN